MNPMSELSYQAIRTANQAREAVKFILIMNFKNGKITKMYDDKTGVKKPKHVHAHVKSHVGLLNYIE